jgi:predicted amidohydrolase
VERIRVASLHYFIRPVQTFEQFRDQVEALVDTAADYKSHLLVFPEYFTIQLLTLGNIKRPINEQIRDLAKQVPRFIEMMSELARQTRIYIVAGTIPTLGDGEDLIHNQSFFFGPGGEFGVQGKLHMTRFETEDWKVSAHSRLRVFETVFGRVAIAICYDVEFPEIARAAAREGVNLLVAPSCTDDRQGFLRVRYCAHARAIENQRIGGMAASLIILWDDYEMKATWRDFTDSGMFTNHDPARGRTLYGAEVMVHPTYQGQGTGKQLYRARRKLVERLGLLRIRAGARLRHYHRHADRLSPAEYVIQVIQGKIGDPTLSFQLKQGFEVLAVVPNYLRHDPESLGYAAIIEWLNRRVAQPEDYAGRDPRFRKP